MESAQAGSQRASSAAEKPQYHHFIPRLILRGFAQDSHDEGKNNTSMALSEKQGIKRKKPQKNGLLHFIRAQDGGLDESRLSRHYGLIDMYRNVRADDQHRLEKKLGDLESLAGELLARARKTFVQPGASLTFSRPEKDILRKFLFLMKYRNSRFSSRFNVATVNEYVEDDKEKMRKYMHDRGFQSPRQVWLDNIHAFLEIEIDDGLK